MTVLAELDRVEDLLDDLDMVRSSEIARRCGVVRWTVSRWKLRLRWDGTRWTQPGCMPVSHLVVAGVEFWSWPLLRLYDPDQFPHVQPRPTELVAQTADEPSGIIE